MGLGDTLNAAMDTVRKYTLSREMTIEEVFDLIQSANLPAEVVGEVKLKKGLFGKSITFKNGSEAIPTLTVKGTNAKLQKVTVQNNSRVSVGGVGIPTNGGMAGAMERANAGSAFFTGVGDALNEILK